MAIKHRGKNFSVKCPQEVRIQRIEELLKDFYKKYEILENYHLENKSELNSIKHKLDNGIVTSLQKILLLIEGDNGNDGLVTTAKINKGNIKLLQSTLVWVISLFGSILVALVSAGIIAAIIHIAGKGI
jgi:hypothetical protein